MCISAPLRTSAGGQKQKEARKLSRRQYWASKSTIEVLAIIGIAWYLKMELIRTKQLPPHVSHSTIQYCTRLTDDVLKVAAIVYNDVYRELESSKIVLLDTGRNDLDGRRGIIQHYDDISSTYQIFIPPKRTNSKKPGSIISVQSECMEPLRRVPLSAYNSNPKVFSHTAVIPNTFNDMPAKEMKVCFRHAILQEVRTKYNNPELDSEHAYTIMNAKVSDIDRTEQERRNKENQHQITQQRAIEDFFSTHTSSNHRPRKRQRLYAPMPTLNRSCQTNAVWDAKIKYIKNMTVSGNKDPHEHLFTYPFRTNDDSFIECLSHSPFWRESNELHKNDRDDLFCKTNGREPIIITTSSIKTVAPGSDIEENVVDLCLKWYVPSAFFPD